MPKKLTKEEFIAREPDLLNGEYEFVGEYINANTKILFKHNVCGYEWKVKPSGFHVGKRCPKCSGNMKLTKEKFIAREPDLVSGEYEFVGEYVNSTTKTLFRHNTCGYEYMTMPSVFQNGKRCPKCAVLRRSNKNRFTKEEFCKREKDIISGEYEFIGRYLNNHTKTLFKHSKCGYEWKIRPSQFHSGSRCPKCAGLIKLTTKEFVERELDLLSGEYSMLGEYRGTSNNILIKHNVCGCKYKVKAGSFHSGSRCPKCLGRILLTKEEFTLRERDIQSGEYEMLGGYENSSTKTLFKHNICGHEWKVAPSSFSSGNRCPQCKQSKGEKRIYQQLNKMNINFGTQKRFETCKYKNTLPFDFFVNSSFLIEYDGEQHFKPVDFNSHGEEATQKSFELGQIRDNIKTQWAKDNGIPLVRIPYTEFDNIEQIVSEAVNKYCKQEAA